MIGAKLIWAIDLCFKIYMFMICARCLLTWIPSIDWDGNPLFRALRDSVDLYLNLFKKFIPPIGPFDFSPVVAMILLVPIWQITIYVFVKLFSILGLFG